MGLALLRKTHKSINNKLLYIEASHVALVVTNPSVKAWEARDEGSKCELDPGEGMIP